MEASQRHTNASGYHIISPAIERAAVVVMFITDNYALDSASYVSLSLSPSRSRARCLSFSLSTDNYALDSASYVSLSFSLSLALSLFLSLARSLSLSLFSSLCHHRLLLLAVEGGMHTQLNAPYTSTLRPHTLVASQLELSLIASFWTSTLRPHT
jgi:hypothetical protein